MMNEDVMMMSEERINMFVDSQYTYSQELDFLAVEQKILEWDIKRKRRFGEYKNLFDIFFSLIEVEIKLGLYHGMSVTA